MIALTEIPQVCLADSSGRGYTGLFWSVVNRSCGVCQSSSSGEFHLSVITTRRGDTKQMTIDCFNDANPFGTLQAVDLNLPRGVLACDPKALDGDNGVRA